MLFGTSAVPLSVQSEGMAILTVPSLQTVRGWDGQVRLGEASADVDIYAVHDVQQVLPSRAFLSTQPSILTIAGQGFRSGYVCEFGVLGAATASSLVSSTQLLCTSPAVTEAGQVDVQVGLPGATVSSGRVVVYELSAELLFIRPL